MVVPSASASASTSASTSASAQSPLLSGDSNHVGFGAVDTVPVFPNPNRSQSPKAINAYDDQFVRIHTTPLSVFHILIVIGNAVQVWFDWEEERYRFILSQAALLFLLTLSYLAIRYEHKRVQAQGYVTFYVEANRLARFVFFTAAFGVCIVCVVYTFWEDNRDFGVLSRTTTLSALVSAESLILFVGLLRYVMVCMEHNRSQLLPDSQRPYLPPALSNADLVASSVSTSPMSGQNSRALIKKQANMIRHLEDKVRSLSQLVVNQQQQIDSGSGLGTSVGSLSSSLRGTSGSGALMTHQSEMPGADYEHTLRSKDQQIRALTVECDALREKHDSLQQSLDETNAFNQMLSDQLEERDDKMDAQRETISRQAREISRLLIQVDVQRDSIVESDRTLDQVQQSSFASPQRHTDASGMIAYSQSPQAFHSNQSYGSSTSMDPTDRYAEEDM
jgi:TMEM192 family